MYLIDQQMGKTLYLTDGTSVSYSKGTITKADGSQTKLKEYKVTGLKYDSCCRKDIWNFLILRKSIKLLKMTVNLQVVTVR